MTRKHKAADGESSIYKDAAGRWHGFVSMNGVKANGRPDRRHVSGRLRADVVEKVRKLEQKRDAGVVLEAGRPMTFGQWLDHWLVNIAQRKVRVSTYVGYESVVRLHIKPALGHYRLDRLQPEYLEDYYATLPAKGLSSATQLMHHRLISRALKVAMQRQRVARNVATLVDAPTVARGEVVPLSTSEARAILKAAEGQRNAARWSVALALGLRQGETLGSTWEDVDLDAGTWRVRQGLQRQAYRHGCGDADACGVKPLKCPERTGGLLYVDPKSAKGKRTIGLPPQIIAALRAHRQAQLAERLAAGSAWHDTDLVFAQVNGKAIDARRDYQAWVDLLAAAGVRKARLHDARHTAATLLLEQGVDARIVMEILGHSQISLTQNTYQHVMPKVITAATTASANALFGADATTVAPPRKRGRSA